MLRIRSGRVRASARLNRRRGQTQVINNGEEEISDDEPANARNIDPDDIAAVRQLLKNMSQQNFQILMQEFLGTGQNSTPVVAPVSVAAPRPSRPASLQIPLYEGKRPGTEGFLSIELFLRTVYRETKVGNYTDAERIMIARDHIRGHARTRCDNAHLLEETTWNSFVARTKAVFSVPRAEIADKLHNLILLRKPGESLDQYIERICAELNNYSPDGDMPDEEKLPHMKRILRAALPQEMRYPLTKTFSRCEELRDEVTGFAEGLPQLRLTDADIAREKEGMTSRGDRKNQPLSVAAAAINNSVPNYRYDDAHSENPSVQEPRYQQARGKGRGSVKFFRCNGCSGGHARSTCTRSRNATCYNCGTLGHLAIVCRKNARSATEPSPMATPNFTTAPPRQRPWTPSQYQPARQPHMALPQQFRAPQLRPPAPIRPQAAPNPAVAAAPIQWANPESFPWQQQQQPQQHQQQWQ